MEDDIRPNVLEPERCQSYKPGPGSDYVQCENRGRERMDHGLPAGRHCDKCWEELIWNAREQSW